MCLGVPGRITRTWVTTEGAHRGEADFAGELRTISLDYLPNLQVGDFTILHAGHALTKLDEVEAQRTLDMMRELGLLPNPQETL